jgi:hypothetical protein
LWVRQGAPPRGSSRAQHAAARDVGDVSASARSCSQYSPSQGPPYLPKKYYPAHHEYTNCVTRPFLLVPPLTDRFDCVQIAAKATYNYLYPPREQHEDKCAGPSVVRAPFRPIALTALRSPQSPSSAKMRSSLFLVPLEMHINSSNRSGSLRDSKCTPIKEYMIVLSVLSSAYGARVWNTHPATLAQKTAQFAPSCAE